MNRGAKIAGLAFGAVVAALFAGWLLAFLFVLFQGRLWMAAPDFGGRPRAFIPLEFVMHHPRLPVSNGETPTFIMHSSAMRAVDLTTLCENLGLGLGLAALWWVVWSRLKNLPGRSFDLAPFNARAVLATWFAVLMVVSTTLSVNALMNLGY